MLLVQRALILIHQMFVLHVHQDVPHVLIMDLLLLVLVVNKHIFFKYQQQHAHRLQLALMDI